MKINVDTLEGTYFTIEAKRDDIVADVKKNIETVQGPNVYPAAQQVLLHYENILKDETTLDENNITENSFIVMLRASNVGPEATARILGPWRDSDSFRDFLTTVQDNPHRLQPMLQHLSEVNPGLLRVIQENMIEFEQLLNEPVEREGNVPQQLAKSMPAESMSIPPEENEEIEHTKSSGSGSSTASALPDNVLEATGFDN